MGQTHQDNPLEVGGLRGAGQRQVAGCGAAALARQRMQAGQRARVPQLAAPVTCMPRSEPCGPYILVRASDCRGGSPPQVLAGLQQPSLALLLEVLHALLSCRLLTLLLINSGSKVHNSQERCHLRKWP